MALSKAEGPFDMLTALSKAEGLRYRHCGVLVISTPHSSRFASLAFGAFYFAVPFLTFYEFISISYDVFFQGICQPVWLISSIFPIIYKTSVEKRGTK
jgi:hypothetical protein